MVQINSDSDILATSVSSCFWGLRYRQDFVVILRSNSSVIPPTFQFGDVYSNKFILFNMESS